ncbi:MAG: outer membrane beta-barrel protein, partial [Gemmatimonadota bacterium]|nr:outer membrane beta-barrel protein [Gemmatimonadota bacterium]
MLVLAASIPLSAQSTAGIPIQFGVMGGRTQPIGALAGAANNDWNFGALALLGGRESRLRFRLDGQWQQVAGKPNGGTLVCVTCGHTSYRRDYRVLDATANAVFSSPVSSSAKVYLIGGVGVYNARGTNSEFPNAQVGPQTSSVTGFGINTGAGVSFGLGRHAGFVEARYHDLLG